MKNKIKSILKILTVAAGCLIFASFSPSLDGRAVVVDNGVFPQGLFAKTVGYLPGDIISVTNIAGDKTIDLLVIGALDPSEGVAIMLSPEAADAMGIDRGANNIVKITKRSGQEERVYGNAVISKSAAEIEDWDDGSFENISAEENTEAFDDSAETEAEPAEETELADAEEAAEDFAEPEELEEAAAEENLEEEEAFEAEEDFEEEEAFEEPEEEAAAEEEEAFEDEDFAEEEATEAEEALEEEEFADETEAAEEYSEEAPEELENAVEEEAFDAEELDELPEEAEETEDAEAALEEAEEESFEEETEEAELEEEELDSELSEEEFDAEAPEELPEEEAELEEMEEESPAAEAFEADELEALPAAELKEEAENTESEEYEAIVLVPAESNPPESDSDEVEDVISEESLDEIDEEINLVPLPSDRKASAFSPISENAKLPAATESSYDKYIVPSLSQLESGKYYIQIAAYSSDENILEVINKYGSNYPVTIVPMAGGKTKQILIGPVTMDEYKVVLERFKSYGFKDAFLRKVK